MRLVQVFGSELMSFQMSLPQKYISSMNGSFNKLCYLIERKKVPRACLCKKNWPSKTS